jgi:hypothetical protein
MPPCCPACFRLNPAGARYCWYDGVALPGSQSASPIAVGSRPFLTPFVFPSGRSCNTFDEWTRGCEAEWNEARSMLAKGFFEGFLAALGRADLAQAAQQCALLADPDEGLDEFLARLPGQRTPPALAVEPREINLGTLGRHESRSFPLNIENTGMGLLAGAARSDVPWLVLGEAPGTAEKHFQCRQDLTLPVQVRGAALRAGNKPQEGRIVVEAGHSALPVIVRVLVPVIPFAEGILAGATTPRQLAEKARAHPRKAAALFESKAVPRWYESNGWTYPVQGPAASGMAAVQQYFEALGLTRPPRVTISQTSVELVGAPGGNVEHFLFVETAENRPVYARAVSETDWLEIARVKVHGASARIHLRVPRVPPRPGERLRGRVVVTSNGNQRFVVEVGLLVQGTTAAAREPPPVRRAGMAAVEAVTAPPVEAPVPLVAARPVPEPPVAAAPRVEAAPAPLVRSSHVPPPVRRPAAVVAAPAPQIEVAPPPPVAAAPGSPVVPPTVRIDPVPLSVDEPPRVHAEVVQSRDRAEAVVVAPLPDGRGSENLFQKVGVREGEASAEPAYPTRQEPHPPGLAPVSIDDVQGPGRRGFLLHVVPLLLIFLVIGGTVLHDLLLPAQGGDGDDDFALIDPTPLVELHFHDGDSPDFQIEPRTMSFGLEILPSRKRLMFERLGRTNNVCIRVDGADFLFGHRGAIFLRGGTTAKQMPGVARWLEMRGSLGRDRKGRKRDGVRSVFQIDGPDPERRLNVEVMQTVEVVPGEQSGRLDTCLVRYTLRNRDDAPHDVGIRFLLDTYIGDNDGVPFTIPGQPGLCSTRRRFDRPEDVPDYIQALEKDDLRSPGTVAHLQFRVKEALEPPSRVLLGGYPDGPLRQLDHPEAAGWYTGWEVPFVTIRELVNGRDQLVNPPREPVPDSAVTLYWDVHRLEPGGRREVGFSYGLGEVASGEGAGKLLLTVGGRTVKGGEFTLTALRASPEEGERLSLRLPSSGVELLSPATQEVPEVSLGAARPQSTVTWRLRANRTGKFALVVESDRGVRQKQTVRIHPPATGVLD